MKNQIFGILFTFLYMVAMLRPLTPIIEYYMNYDYIVKELCINRDKPQLKCNGQCYLTSKMEKLDPSGSESKPDIATPINFKDYPISTLDFYKISIDYLLPFTQKENLFIANHLKNSAYKSSIFKPPIF